MITYIIRASLSKPHTSRYYKKITVLMYVCMCVCVSAIRHPHVVLVHVYVLTVTFNIQYSLNTCNSKLKRGLADSIEEVQAK